MKHHNFDINETYSKAMEFASSHYENFPVVSFLIKKSIRKHIAIIYWFARTADDIADEGDKSPEQRTSELQSFRKRFLSTLNGEYCDAFDEALHDTILKFTLEPELFLNLLSAFEQDITQHSYNSLTELLGYCQNSANPVGRLVLRLHGIRNEKADEFSDNICTALQLTNFWQDASIDFSRGRLYIPLEEIYRFGTKIISPNHLIASQIPIECISSLVNFTEELFAKGTALDNFLSGLLRYEIRWTIFGGLAVLKKIRYIDYKIFDYRVTLSKTDFIRLLLNSFLYAPGKRKADSKTK